MIKTLGLISLAIGLLIGCAQERAEDKVYTSPRVGGKSIVKTHDAKTGLAIKYLYVPMTMGTPRKVAAAAPFVQGDEKVVKLKWVEDGLEVVEIERDERFADNELNDSPVLTIPGKHLAYRCEEDEYGDCTNKQEENEELEWHEKNYFEPNFRELRVTELNSLDTQNINGNNCIEPQGVELVDYEISDGVINIELEKSYRTKSSWRCFRKSMNFDTWKLESASFKVRFFYSIVELDKIKTSDYVAVDYPIADHDKFGFFKDVDKKLNDNFDDQREVYSALLNRWAPNRENNELVYYLSQNFSKPENKVYLDATHKSVEMINKGLAAAKTPFKMVVKEQAEGKEKRPGDLRYNTIVLIEDPLANGLLGYGPTVTNPYTGEIVQAHINMYGGMLKQIVRRSYNAAVDLTEQKYQEAKPKYMATEVTVSAQALGASLPTDLANYFATAKKTEEEAVKETDPTPAKVSKEELIDHSQVYEQESTASEKHSYKMSKENFQMMMDQRMHQKMNARYDEFNHRSKDEAIDLEDESDGVDAIDKKTLQLEAQEYGSGFKHKHQPEFFPIGGTVKVVYPELLAIADILTSKKTLKPWAMLDSKQQKEVSDIMAGKAWIATFVHELGHNLGLRHNFTGSTDKKNFFSISEAKELGLNYQPAYSSVMDYSYSALNQLKALGKYDVAALRFAYAREVELKDGSFKKLEKNLSSLKTELAALRFDKTKQSLTKEIFDLKKDIYKLEDNGATPAETKGLWSVVNQKQTYVDTITVKSYAFCTDENAGLTSKCNRFDEGTNLLEIAQHKIEHYERMYKYRNFRDGRLDFKANILSSYMTWRNKEFGSIRDLIEEYEFYNTRFDMINGCDEKGVKRYPWNCIPINKSIESMKLVGKFFIDILKTPDHICALVKKSKPTVIVQYAKLAEIYQQIKRSIDHVPTSCFDVAVQEDVQTKGFLVLAENGKFLNGFKGTNPNYKYISDRAVIGTWPDRLLAMKNLFKRRSTKSATDLNHMALVDIPFIQKEVRSILSHYAMGEAINDPIPFKMQNGVIFKVPYIIGDDYKINQLQDRFYWMKKSLGMHSSGKSSFVEVLMHQISKIGVKYGEENGLNAFKAANIVSVEKFGSVTPLPQSRSRKTFNYFDDLTHITYIADGNTPIAQNMLASIQAKPIFDSMDIERIKSVYNNRVNPKAPKDMSEEDKEFFNLAEKWQKNILGYALKGQGLKTDAVINKFGEKSGKLILAVFAKGPVELKKILKQRKRISNTPIVEENAPMYLLPILVLERYIEGALTDQVLEYYKFQLKRMPNYQSAANY
jgi:ribosomal protein L29